MQEIAWYTTVVIVAAIGVVFLLVASSVDRPAEYSAVQPAAYRWRAQLFWGLVILGIIVAAGTLRGLPYLRAGDPVAAQVVVAKGAQWYWELDRDSVAAGEPVEFQITATDVNHGFGIYDADTRLVAQAQAMPGYVNRLRHTFTRPGTYRLMCLEYCGLGHHDMISELQVTAPK